MELKDVLKTVRTLINDADVEDDSFSKETDAALEEFVRIALRMLSQTDHIAATPTVLQTGATWIARPDGLLCAEIAMPSDMICFVSVKLDEWPYRVTHLLPDSSPSYAAQYTTVKGLGNGPHNPIAFYGGDTQRIITAHAAVSERNFELCYIPVLDITSQGNIPLPDKYDKALAYITAALYHESRGEKDLAETELSIGHQLTDIAKKEDSV